MVTLKLLRLLLALAVLYYIYPQPIVIAAEQDRSSVPVFTFVHITDTHIIDTDSIKAPNYQFSTQLFERFTELLNTEKNHKLPDFVIISGDLTDKGDKKSFIKFMKLTQKINCPVYFLGGNHDVMQWRNSEKTDWDKTYYTQIFGTSAWNNSILYNNALVLTASLRRSDGENTVAWIENELKTTTGTFTIVSTHFPVYGQRKNFSYMGISEYLGGMGFDLQKHFDRYSKDRVILYLTGHTHINSVSRKSNVWNVTTSALGSPTSSGYRFFEVNDNKVKSTFYHVTLSSSTVPIEFKPGTKTDNYHLSPEENRFGTEIERKFEFSTIPEKDFFRTISYQMLTEGTVPPPAYWLKSILIYPSTRTFVIDGKYDDTEWKSTTTVSLYRFRDSQNKPLPFGTTAYVAYDKENLYFFIKCHDPYISTITATLTQRDDNLWIDDSVDVYLAPGGQQSQYFHFIVNPLNTQYDETCYNYGRTRSSTWDGRWYSAVDKGQDYWNIEIKIPFKTIGSSSPVGFNISRRRVYGFYNLSYTGIQKSLHQPQKFACFYLMK